MAFRSRTCTSTLLQRIATNRAGTTLSPFASSRIRIMSTSAPARTYEWLVVIPDKPGALAKRLEVRPQHFAGLKTNIENGCFQMGGAILEEVPVDDEPSSMKMSGSTIVMVASSKEEIINLLREDVYAKNGVWDVDNVQMWPLKCAFRIPVKGQQV